MPSYLSPGQYMEETKSAPSIQGASTSIGAFAGVTERGRFGSFAVNSFKAFVDEYGSYITNSLLAYAVKGFFDNGGAVAYISRVVHLSVGVKTSTKATVNVLVTAIPAITIDAKSDGLWGNAISATIANYLAGTFDFIVNVNGVATETYKGVTMYTLDALILASSKLVVTTTLTPLAVIANATVSLIGGTDGITSLASSDYIGDSSSRSGIYAFMNDPINLLAIPGVSDAVICAGLETYTSTRRVSAIMETPLAKTPATALTFRNTISLTSSSRSNMYYPWILVSDPIGVGINPTKLIPPSGHVMGAFARTDDSRGVWKAPAGQVDGKLNNVLGLEYNVSQDEQDTLNPIGVNCIRSFAGIGIVIWGARTQAPAGDTFQYTPVRRVTDYVEQNIIANSRWTTFEPNNETLYGKIKTSVDGFLRGLWRDGGLAGLSEAEAFYCLCDKNTTLASDVLAGKVYVEIGIATQKPAEFIIFKVAVR